MVEARNNEEVGWFPKLGSYIILLAVARGDYGWKGQAAIAVLLGYTPGSRQLKKTMEDILNRQTELSAVCFFCLNTLN
jgi:hypothetical protein